MGTIKKGVSVRRLARASRSMELGEFLAAAGNPLAFLVGPGSLDRSSVSLTLGEPDPRIQLLSPADFDRFEALMVPRTGGEVLLGRGDDADVFLRGVSISKRHASLRQEADGRLVLTDLRSRNGTFVRSAMVARGTAVYVNPGDLLQFGSRALKLYEPSSLYTTLRRLILTH